MNQWLCPESSTSNEESELIPVLSKKCVWNIVRVLLRSRSNIVNITALVNALRANYDYVAKCLRIMEKYGMIETAKIGRLRLVKLNTDNDIVAKMIELLSNDKSVSSSSL